MVCGFYLLYFSGFGVGVFVGSFLIGGVGCVVDYWYGLGVFIVGMVGIGCLVVFVVVIYLCLCW